ncbi:hypothetical protein DSM104299_01170 [Baekduia alba]|uniref:hypothetical protein n=1 Tax=Baekduia alba TaxID=2997333 RepID=UPI00233F9DB1|nr:hypothetical protein [Baekduia alba]WCB92474.1 hypothetical protein DSM104299_01170 [Baekduia alba]
MTDAHLVILRAMAKIRRSRLDAEDGPDGAPEGPPTKRRSDLEQRSSQARSELSRAQARRTTPLDQ